MKKRIVSIMGASLVLLALVWPVQAVEVAVELENLAPHGGVLLSPVWVGFDGQQFKLSTAPASAGLTLLATTGNASLLRQEFRTAAPDGVDGIISASAGSSNAPNFAPGTQGIGTFALDPTTDRFMNFASKVYPLAGGFIASTTPIEIFDAQGNFKGKQIVTILGSEVMQTGSGSTTTTDRSRTSTITAAAVTAQPPLIVPNTNEAAAAAALTGSLTGIKFDSVASNVKLPNAVVARITVVPEPATIFLLAGGSLILLRRRKSTNG